MKKNIGLSLGLLILSSCGERQSAPSTGKVIVGENDLVPVTDERLLAAVGKFSDFCTGFHIGQGLIVTAGHCLDESNGEDALCNDGLYFEWEEAGKGRQVKKRAECRRVIFREESPRRDIALVQVSPNPPEAIAPDLEGVEMIGEGVSVEVVSEPKGSSLSSSGPCYLIGADEGARYFHDCDTSDGSSGAPVFSANGLVIGIHNRGSKFLKKNSLTLISASHEIMSALSEAANSKSNLATDSQ